MESLPENIFHHMLQPLSLKAKLNVRLVSQRCKRLAESAMQLSLCVYSDARNSQLPRHARFTALPANDDDETYALFAYLTSVENGVRGRYAFNSTGHANQAKFIRESESKRKPFNDLITFLLTEDTRIHNFVRIISLDFRNPVPHGRILDMLDVALRLGKCKLRIQCSILMPTDQPFDSTERPTVAAAYTAPTFNSTSLAYQFPSFQLASLSLLYPAVDENVEENTELINFSRYFLLHQSSLEELSASPAWLSVVLREGFLTNPQSNWKLSLKRLALNYDAGAAIDGLLSILRGHFPNLVELTASTQGQSSSAKEITFPLQSLSRQSKLRMLSLASGEAKILLQSLEDNVRFSQLRALCIKDVQLPTKDPTFFAHLPVLEDLTILVSDPYSRQKENHETVVANLENRSFRSLRNLTWGSGPGYASNSTLLETCNAARHCPTLHKLTNQRGDNLRQLRALFYGFGGSEDLLQPKLLQLPVKIASTTESESFAREIFNGQNETGLRNLQLRCLFAQNGVEAKRLLCQAVDELARQITSQGCDDEDVSLVDYSKTFRAVPMTVDLDRHSKGVAAVAANQDITAVSLRWKKRIRGSYNQNYARHSFKLLF